MYVVPEVNAFLLLVFASHGNHTQTTAVGEYYMSVCGWVVGWGGVGRGEEGRGEEGSGEIKAEINVQKIQRGIYVQFINVY